MILQHIDNRDNVVQHEVPIRPDQVHPNGEDINLTNNLVRPENLGGGDRGRAVSRNAFSVRTATCILTVSSAGTRYERMIVCRCGM